MLAICLTVVILALAATQPSRNRLAVAVAYAGINFAHSAVVAPFISGAWYYLSAAMADLIIMALILQVARLPSLGVFLLRMCLVEILLNAIGWMMWYHYIDPGAYSAVYMVGQVAIIVAMMMRDRADELGGYRLGGLFDRLRLVVGAGSYHVQDRSPKA